MSTSHFTIITHWGFVTYIYESVNCGIFKVQPMAFVITWRIVDLFLVEFELKRESLI